MTKGMTLRLAIVTVALTVLTYKLTTYTNSTDVDTATLSQIGSMVLGFFTVILWIITLINFVLGEDK